MIKNKITDGLGSQRSAHVTEDHALLVTTLPYDYSTDLKKKILPFRQYFTVDGTAGGSYDLRVDGSSTPVNFWIPSSQTAERFVTTLSFAISDTILTPAKFAGITALTNGVQLYYTAADYGNIYIHDALKSNFDFIRLGLGQPALGNANDAFTISNVVGNADSYIPFVDLGRFIPPYGVHLAKASNERLILSIRDNISAIDGFDCIAYGYDLVDIGL